MSTTKKIPLRKCIGCGEMKDKREMMRVLKSADNAITIDTTGKKNGRGAYLCYSQECLEQAMKNRGLERSFKMAISKEVYEALQKEFDALGTK